MILPEKLPNKFMVIATEDYRFKLNDVPDWHQKDVIPFERTGGWPDGIWNTHCSSVPSNCFAAFNYSEEYILDNIRQGVWVFLHWDNSFQALSEYK